MRLRREWKFANGRSDGDSISRLKYGSKRCSLIEPNCISFREVTVLHHSSPSSSSSSSSASSSSSSSSCTNVWITSSKSFCSDESQAVPSHGQDVTITPLLYPLQNPSNQQSKVRSRTTPLMMMAVIYVMLLRMTLR